MTNCINHCPSMKVYATIQYPKLNWVKRTVHKIQTAKIYTKWTPRRLVQSCSVVPSTPTFKLYKIWKRKNPKVIPKICSICGYRSSHLSCNSLYRCQLTSLQKLFSTLKLRVVRVFDFFIPPPPPIKAYRPDMTSTLQPTALNFYQGVNFSKQISHKHQRYDMLYL